MSQHLIHTYLRELEVLRTVSGSRRETVVREAFKDLLKDWGRPLGLTFVAEYALTTAFKTRVVLDGALLHELRLPLGHWEAKDADDDLDAEIAAKFRKGYPRDNILFTDDAVAILIQHGQAVGRCDMTDPVALERLVRTFFAFERPEIADFRAAVAQFGQDLPAVLAALRDLIAAQEAGNPAFRDAAAAFLAQARAVVNPELGAADVREMLIQHILTEDIFAQVFGDSDFHRHNNVARALYGLEEVFFTGALKKQTLKGLEPYYAAIRAAAARLAGHGEKQTFLKVIYEQFYRVYNPQAADRLGVVYTPNEIVRFMIAGADWLCERQFGRRLIDPDVDILDPATGTGTYICELLEHFRGQPARLEHKYRHELHANEAAILPYYVANLNIEATYAGITGQYADFANLCFVDTLDNVGLHTQASGTTGDLFGAVSAENVARIKRQNARRISVVIGNPPYNANQANENDNNKNRVYPAIDRRLKDTYIAASTAQKTKLYDMYARFFRWASDRLAADGILAFVTNRSFLDSRTFDGFRQTIAREFAEIWVLDLGGDVRANPKLSGTRHNVFGIQTGVAISFLVKKSPASNSPSPSGRGVGVREKGPSATARIFYARRPELETAEEKLRFLSATPPWEVAFEEIRPDARNNWLNLTDNDFETHLALTSRQGRGYVFATGFNGIKTNRDDWVFDFSATTLLAKTQYFVERLNAQIASGQSNAADLDYSIKWSSGLKAVKSPVSVSEKNIVSATLRPFVDVFYCTKKELSDRLTSHHTSTWGAKLDVPNRTICFVFGSRLDFCVFVVKRPISYSLLVLDPVYCIPEFRLDEAGNRLDNITDWSLKQFRAHYKTLAPSPRPSPSGGGSKKARKIDKEDIFHYCYAVLHDPIYREKYALNLKRDFPRIPFYPDFWRWADWGRELLDLHLGYETIAPFPLTRIDTPDERARAANLSPKVLLRADPEAGAIRLDSETALTGIPPDAWTYRLGNRSALDWILDQYKEKTPKDPTIRERFDTYRFADHKEFVIDLLGRVTAVSVATMRIVGAMRTLAHPTTENERP